MQIGCTKKLLDKLKVKTEKGTDANPLFSWSANFMVVDRRAMVVVTNDATRFAFFMYGLKMKEWKHFEAVVLEEMVNALRRYYLKEEVIEKYVATAGAVELTKTADRGFVARVNKVTEIMTYCLDIINPETISQPQLAGFVNRDLFSMNKGKDYYYARELFAEKLTAWYGGPIFDCPMAELAISLDLGDTSAERHVCVPLDYTLEQLHQCIQEAYAWT
ncbi:MAG: DUF6933 domain-containing protein, partial [Bacilli bacterium]